MTFQHVDRRSVLKLLAAAGATPLGLAAGTAHAQQPITVGVVYSGSKQDYGYNQSHAQAAAALKKAPGVKVVEEERVPETIAVQRSMEGIIAPSHSLKSTSANLGALRLSELAKRLEHGARTGELTEPLILVSELKREYQQVATALTELLAKDRV